MTAVSTPAIADAGAVPERRRGIDRVVALLDALLRHGAPMGAGDLARATGAPRSTTYEIIASLVAAGILEEQGGAVFFGPATHLFGEAYARHSHRRVGAALDALSAATGETVQLCGLRGAKYVVLDCRDGPGPFRITSRVGVEVPIPWTASGRVLLGEMAEEDALALIPPEDFRLPDGRTVAPGEFLGEIARARRDGFCETTGLADRFTHCIAVPLREGGRVARTLCCVVPAGTPAARRDSLRALLVDAAAALSR